jgi:predicted aspartyl protease
VTAVVAILKVFGDKSNSRNSKLLIKPNKWLNLKKTDLNQSNKHLNRLSKPVSDVSERLIVKQKTIRVLLDTGSSGDLLFIKKGSQKYIPTVKRAVPQLWGTSNGTFQTKKVGTIDISFMEYSTSVGAPSPLYDLIIGKQTLHDIGAVLDFKEKTITIDSILLPMRNNVNLQLKPSVTKALQHNTVQAQEPVSTQKATKRVIEILDAKYDKANLLEIVKDNCSHLEPSQQEKLLSLLLDYKSPFDGTLPT